jgi:hypothetical protein
MGITTPPDTSKREAVQAFVDAMDSKWYVYDDGDKPYAGRRFEYRSGAQALLSVKPFRWLADPSRYLTSAPLDLVREWESAVSLPFSAGPEGSTIGRLAAVRDWAFAQQRVLALPFKLQECKSQESAEAIVAGFLAAELTLLAVVFDIDYYQSRKQLVQAIAKACAPAGRR